MFLSKNGQNVPEMANLFEFFPQKISSLLFSEQKLTNPTSEKNVVWFFSHMPKCFPSVALQDTLINYIWRKNCLINLTADIDSRIVKDGL